MSFAPSQTLLFLIYIICTCSIEIYLLSTFKYGSENIYLICCFFLFRLKSTQYVVKQQIYTKTRTVNNSQERQQSSMEEGSTGVVTLRRTLRYWDKGRFEREREIKRVIQLMRQRTRQIRYVKYIYHGIIIDGNGRERARYTYMYIYIYIYREREREIKIQFLIY